MGGVLFSFLGGVGAQPQKTFYRLGRYDFGGSVSRETTLFVLALLDHLAASDPTAAPERIVILGTPGSMWDEFLRAWMPGIEAEHEDLILALWDAARDDRVDLALLDRAERILRERGGMPVELVPIPYCRTWPETVELVRIVNEHAGGNRDIILDVTHGLRHLPILALFAAVTVEAMTDAEVTAVWYGAGDMARGKPAPVLRLEGVLEYLRWIRGLAAFEASGDLSAIGHLLERDTGVKIGRDLGAASFHLRTHNIDLARTAVRRASEALARSTGTVSPLFRSRVRKRLAWADANDLSSQQLSLARLNLHDGAFVGAAILGYEAILSRVAERTWPKADPSGKDIREAARALARRQYDGSSRPEARAYWGLNDIRNTLAHAGEDGKPEIEVVRSSAASLSAAIAGYLDDYFGPES